MSGETYGPLKALCEAVVREAFPGRALVIRRLIVGPFDPTDRFTYWPWRYARQRGARPRPPRPPGAVRRRPRSGRLDGAPRRRRRRRRLQRHRPPGRAPARRLHRRRVARRLPPHAGAPGASTVWADGAFLVAQGIRPWTEYPLNSGGGRPHERYAARELHRTPAAGLTFRPVARTVQDTLDWARRRPGAPGAPASRRPARRRRSAPRAQAQERAAGRPGGAGRGQTGEPS